MARNVEVVVGVVGRPHGIRGELGIDVRTDEPATRFADGVRLHAEGAPHRTWEVIGSRWNVDRLLLRLSGVGDRDAADRMRGERLAVMVSAADRPDDETEFYDHQLVGLRVCDHEHQVVGEVTEVVHLPAHDLLRIRLADGEPRLIPFALAVVPVVDLDAGEVVLGDIPGLLAEYDDELDETTGDETTGDAAAGAAGDESADEPHEDDADRA